MAVVNITLTLSADQAVIARVVAAIRGLFPDVATPDLADKQAAAAVLRYHARSWVTSWEAMQAGSPDKAASDAAHAVVVAAQNASQAAQVATESLQVT